MFSEREEKIIKIIGRRKMTFDQISKELFRDLRKAPFDRNISVANSVRRIIKKCSHFDLSWTLDKIRQNNKLTIKRSIK